MNKFAKDGMKKMDEKQKEFLLKMIGTEGIKKLVAISTLFPENHSYQNPYLLACHFLNVMLDRCERMILQEIGSEKIEEKE